MNEFTKEELKNIIKCIYYTYTHEQISPEIHLFLRSKVESMIDNYCEHEWHNHCPECNPLNIYCKKCREYLRDNHKIDCDNYCEHEWINVNDQLPDDGQNVIAYCENYPENFVSMVRFEKNKSGYYFWNDALDKKGNVIYWMSMPKPPTV